MRVCVTGGRTFDDANLLNGVLDALHAERGVDCVIHGKAQGADMMADAWARNHGIKVFRRRANWVKYGMAAGPIRNGELLRLGRPDLVLAFPGGKGTADMMRQADKAGVPVKTYPEVG